MNYFVVLSKILNVYHNNIKFEFNNIVMTFIELKC